MISPQHGFGPANGYEIVAAIRDDLQPRFYIPPKRPQRAVVCGLIAVMFWTVYGPLKRIPFRELGYARGPWPKALISGNQDAARRGIYARGDPNSPWGDRLVDRDRVSPTRQGQRTAPSRGGPNIVGLFVDLINAAITTTTRGLVRNAIQLPSNQDEVAPDSGDPSFTPSAGPIPGGGFYDPNTGQVNPAVEPTAFSDPNPLTQPDAPGGVDTPPDLPYSPTSRVPL